MYQFSNEHPFCHSEPVAHSISLKCDPEQRRTGRRIWPHKTTDKIFRLSANTEALKMTKRELFALSVIPDRKFTLCIQDPDIKKTENLFIFWILNRVQDDRRDEIPDQVRDDGITKPISGFIVRTLVRTISRSSSRVTSNDRFEYRAWIPVDTGMTRNNPCSLQPYQVKIVTTTKFRGV